MTRTMRALALILLVLGMAGMRMATPTLASIPDPGGGGGGSLTSQTISFDLSTLPAKTYGDVPFDISSYASASSGLTVNFSSATTSVCTVFVSTVTIVSAGTCTINADQPGDSTYAVAPQVQQSFTIAKAGQTISFGPLSDQLSTAAPFTVSATGGASGNPVTFTAGLLSVCTASGTNGSTITVVGVGSCTVTASQAGDGNYLGATDVQQSFSVVQPTAARVTTFTAIHHGATIRVTWRLAVQSGLIGFNVVAGTHRLNAQMIPVHRGGQYRVTLGARASSPVTLMGVLQSGSQIWLATR